MAGASSRVPNGLRASVKENRLMWPPSLGNLRPKGRGFGEDEKYNNWVKTRLRQIWPLDIPRHSASERGGIT